MKLTQTPRRLADAAIGGYQRHLSPRKGYQCAHGALHGGDTCSAAVRRIVRERGVLGGLRPTVAQFVACYQAAALLKLVPGEVRGVCCCGPFPIPFRF
ncbi:MAG TPA: membrane protein insertion efficiency factor YidD [Propionibacterium sp.]|nr:membrane protein insertion efficiency factor YidD [Propionibacterium sp.]